MTRTWTEPPLTAPELVLIDNRDSFTWNLAQAFLALGAAVEVVRAEVLDLRRIEPGSGTTHVVVGPGPGGPAETAISRESLLCCRGRIPWLGVCLGHQVLAEALGGRVRPTGSPVHGKSHWIDHDGSGIFGGLPRPFQAARYHSLAVVEDDLPSPLRVVARVSPRSSGDVSPAGDVMGCGVPGEATWGVQFHPESFMTPEGSLLLRAFLDGVPCPDAGSSR